MRQPLMAMAASTIRGFPLPVRTAPKRAKLHLEHDLAKPKDKGARNAEHGLESGRWDFDAFENKLQ